MLTFCLTTRGHDEGITTSLLFDWSENKFSESHDESKDVVMCLDTGGALRDTGVLDGNILEVAWW